MEAPLMKPGRIKSGTKIAGFEVLSYLKRLQAALSPGSALAP